MTSTSPARISVLPCGITVSFPRRIWITSSSFGNFSAASVLPFQSCDLQFVQLDMPQLFAAVSGSQYCHITGTEHGISPRCQTVVAAKNCCQNGFRRQCQGTDRSPYPTVSSLQRQPQQL